MTNEIRARLAAMGFTGLPTDAPYYTPAYWQGIPCKVLYAEQYLYVAFGKRDYRGLITVNDTFMIEFDADELSNVRLNL